MVLCSKILTFTLPDGKVLLVNCLSGAVDLVSKDVADNMLAETLPANERIQWEKRGYYLPSFESEKMIQTRIIKTSKIMLARSPLVAIIMPTDSCNLRCSYCYERQTSLTARASVNMGPDKVAALFSALVNIMTERQSQQISIGLYGGEPLLRANEETITRILEESLTHNFPVDFVITNGTTLDYYAKSLARYKVKAVQVTIDGPESVHDARRPCIGGQGSFEKVVRGIDSALHHGLEVIARTNLDLENVEALPDLAIFYQKRGWLSNPHFKPYASIVTTPSCKGSDLCARDDPDVIGEVLKVIGKNWNRLAGWKFKFDRIEHIANVLAKGQSFYPRVWYCAAGKNMFVFDPQGRIYPCLEHVGTDQECGYYFPALKFDERASQWRERTIETISECKECSFNLLCGGGCAYQAYKRFGTLQAPSCYEPQKILRLLVPFLYRYLYLERREEQ